MGKDNSRRSGFATGAERDAESSISDGQFPMENLQPSVIEAHRKSAIENRRSKINDRKSDLDISALRDE
jgi:hypothetical protein